MIRSLELNNFQSHKNSLLEFDPGVNIIVGNTDSGKSSLIRSLKLVIYNKPSGDSFISHWAKQLNVKLEVDDHTIQRVKGSSNKYILDDKEFTSFGTTTPDEINQVINMSDVNTQFQLDPAFLLSSTSGEVAQYLNKVANLDQIDKSQKNIKREITQLSKKVEFYDTNIKQNREKLENFKFVKKLENSLKEITKEQERLNSNHQKRSKIAKLVTDTKEVQNQCRNEKEFVRNESLVNKAIDKLNYVKKLRQEKEKLQNLISKIQTTKNDISSLSEASKFEPLVHRIENLKQALSKRKIERNKIQSLCNSVHSVSKKVESQKQKVFQKEEYFHNNFPDVCPLCGTQNPEL
ncbi:MAG: AAA family ATPase [Bacteroidales bacterium]